MTTTTNIMNFLDDNKEDMSEGLYLKFCNLLKKENEDEEKEDEKFYEVKYLYTKFEPLNDVYNYYSAKMSVSNQIIKINTKLYKAIQDDIEKDGYSWKGHDDLAFDGTFNDHNICYKELCDENDCGCDGGHINATTIYVRSETKIIKITEA